jgi:hypothetical protein
MPTPGGKPKKGEYINFGQSAPIQRAQVVKRTDGANYSVKVYAKVAGIHKAWWINEFEWWMSHKDWKIEER